MEVMEHCLPQEMEANHCSICDKTYESREKLIRHERYHSADALVCSLCQKKFPTKGNLRFHMLSHSNEKPHVCSVCGKRFRRMAELKQHSATHESIRKRYECSHCDRTFLKPNVLRNHEKTHTGKGLVTCPICDQKFIETSRLTKHLRTHTGEKLSFFCQLCRKEFTTKYAVTEHMRIHSGEKPYFCKACDQSFHSNSALKKHRQRKHPQQRREPESIDEAQDGRGSMETTDGPMPEEPGGSERQKQGEAQCHPCRVCHKTFATLLSLKKHQKRHGKEKPHECPLCMMGFLYACELRKHLETHDAERKRFSCSFCDKTFLTQTGQASHAKRHTGNGLLACPLCDKTFPSVSGLRVHLRTHTGEKFLTRVFCEVCGKEFRDRSSLICHARLHTGERPFACEMCPATFARREYLNLHTRRKHKETNKEETEVAPQGARVRIKDGPKNTSTSSSSMTQRGGKCYTCETCQKTFPRLPLLKFHLRIHKGEKPFTCPVCKESFFTLYALTKHKQTHDAVRKSYKCAFCDKSYFCPKSRAWHQKGHTGQARFSCRVCNMTFSYRTVWKQHMLGHTEKATLTCGYCRRSFGEISELGEHLKLHNTNGNLLDSNTNQKSKTRNYTCNICHVSFVHKTWLQRHLTVHTGVKPYPCGICSETCLTLLELRQHKAKHRRERMKHACTLCDKRFLTKQGLTLHLKYHTGRILFTCTECDKKFTTISQWKIHMERHSEKTVQCQLCPKRFRGKYELNRHVLLGHNGPKPYVCKICHARFKLRKFLKAHTKREHVEAAADETGEQTPSASNPGCTTELPKTVIESIIPEISSEDYSNANEEVFSDCGISQIHREAPQQKTEFDHQVETDEKTDGSVFVSKGEMFKEPGVGMSMIEQFYDDEIPQRNLEINLEVKEEEIKYPIQN